MKSILIFGLSFLQKSLILQCRELGIKTIGIDISENPLCAEDVDAFEQVSGDNYERTIEVAKKYNVNGVICAATDKPLVMMARVAKALNLPFYSVDTAIWSTDKLLMKERFQQGGVPCAKGVVISSFEDFKREKWKFPLIVKPRDSSGSRGVIYCKDEAAVSDAIQEALMYSKKGNVLVEEFIDGPEYSIESLHYKGKTHVLQFTQKQTTSFPYNVELGHIQPADLTDKQKEEIGEIINKIAAIFKFDNCASHTELKICSGKIVVIETSPRLGGDFITSKLVPLSTGINMEKLLIKIAVGEEVGEDDFVPGIKRCSAIRFFNLTEGEIIFIGDLGKIKKVAGFKEYNFDLKKGDSINKITSSLNRYGWCILDASDRHELLGNLYKVMVIVNKAVIVK
jgi:carbamoyl-phosphate synthase large subunit